ncbi:hypothetical protein [Phyllobacterium sp. SB3]|uniref:hypothetical protein n=1 Tax=Phyllobacterium sp. SB3 TaxID=3156073 RepID=UPI0032AE93FB
MKPPGIVVTSLLVTIGYAGLFVTQPAPPLAPVVERYALPEQAVALNEDLIRRYLYGYAPVAATARELERKPETVESAALLDAKAREFGFASYSDWLNINNTIMVTYHWAIHPQPKQEVDKAIAEVPTRVNLSEADKVSLINDLKTGLARVENARPTAENLAVVERHLRSLKPFYNQWAKQQ